MNRFSRYTGHPIVGRGDLVEAIGSRDEDTLRAVADQLGMRYVTKVPEVVDKIVFKDSSHVMDVPGKID